MRNRINPDSPVPIYYQLKEIIVEGINSGQWRLGEMIPSENQLCREYNVSRNTAQRALDELVKDGILIRRQGVGTFVTEPKIEQAISHFYSFSDAVAARNMKHTADVLEQEVMLASPKQAKALKLQEGEYVTALTRLRMVDGDPFVLETSYIPLRLAPGLEKIDFTERSLYKTLANKYSVYVTKAEEIFEPVLVGNSDSKLLNVEEGSPAILIERVAYSSTDEPVEHCFSIIPGSKCRFYSELR